MRRVLNGEFRALPEFDGRWGVPAGSIRWRATVTFRRIPSSAAVFANHQIAGTSGERIPPWTLQAEDAP